MSVAVIVVLTRTSVGCSVYVHTRANPITLAEGDEAVHAPGERDHGEFHRYATGFLGELCFLGEALR